MTKKTVNKPMYVTHKSLEARREKLKEKSLDEFFEFKKKRYALFRMQTFLDGGASPDPEHLEFAKELEKETEELGGVKQFAIIWDLDPLTSKVIIRDKSIWQVHEEYMDKAVTLLAEDEEGNIVAPKAVKKG